MSSLMSPLAVIAGADAGEGVGQAVAGGAFEGLRRGGVGDGRYLAVGDGYGAHRFGGGVAFAVADVVAQGIDAGVAESATREGANAVYGDSDVAGEVALAGIGCADAGDGVA